MDVPTEKILTLMTIDFEALQLLVDAAKTEADEATATADAMAAVNVSLAQVQESLDVAIAAAMKENAERVSALQAIGDIVQRYMEKWHVLQDAL